MDPIGTRDHAADGDRSVLLLRLLWLLWLPLLYPVTGFLRTYPLVSLLRGHPTPLRLGLTLAGVALFVGVYVWATWYNTLSPVPAAARVPGLPSWLPLAVLTALGVAQTLANGKDWLTLFIFVSASVGARLPVRQSAGAVVALALVTLAVGWIAHAGVSLVAPTLVLVVFVGVIGVSLVQVVATNRALRAARAEIARLAVNEERLRFARDLHDLLGHNLSHIALKSEVAEALVPTAPDHAIAAMREVGGVARTALQEVRATVSGYRQPTLAGELRGAGEILAAAGIAYRCEGENVVLPPAAEAALAWTVREGVTNLIRHSRATHCTVRVSQTERCASVEIVNDGREAADTASASSASAHGVGGNGLAGIRERIAAVGGRSEAGPVSGGGFRLSVTLPIRTMVDSGAVERGA